MNGLLSTSASAYLISSKVNLPSASFFTVCSNFLPSYSWKLNSPSFSVRPFSSFIPLITVLPVASYTLTSSAFTSLFSGMVPVRSSSAVICVQPVGTVSVTVYSVPAGSPMIFTLSPSLIVMVATPSLNVTVSDVTFAPSVLSALKSPFRATLFFVALIVTSNVLTSPVLSPTFTVLVITRSPRFSVFLNPFVVGTVV